MPLDPQTKLKKNEKPPKEKPKKPRGRPKGSLNKANRKPVHVIAREAGLDVENHMVKKAAATSDRVADFVAEYLKEHKVIPTGTTVAKELGISLTTALRHMEYIDIKGIAARRNADVVAKHFKVLTEDEKPAPAMFDMWYKNFGVEEKEKPQEKKQTGKVVINIVTSKPNNVQIEDAEIVQE